RGNAGVGGRRGLRRCDRAAGTGSRAGTELNAWPKRPRWLERSDCNAIRLALQQARPTAASILSRLMRAAARARAKCLAYATVVSHQRRLCGTLPTRPCDCSMIAEMLSLKMAKLMVATLLLNLKLVLRVYRILAECARLNSSDESGTVLMFRLVRRSSHHRVGARLPAGLC